MHLIIYLMFHKAHSIGKCHKHIIYVYNLLTPFLPVYCASLPAVLSWSASRSRASVLKTTMSLPNKSGRGDVWPVKGICSPCQLAQRHSFVSWHVSHTFIGQISSSAMKHGFMFWPWLHPREGRVDSEERPVSEQVIWFQCHTLLKGRIHLLMYDVFPRRKNMTIAKLP